jgi:hypothetical protein
VTVDEAARHYGLTVDAIRKRVQRKKIPHEKDSAGRVRIILDEPETLQDESPDSTGQRAAQDVRGELIEELRDRVRYLEKALDEEREARTEERRRHDTVLAQLSAANAEQARTIRELEAPEGVEPGSAAEETREELVAERALREMAEATLHEGMAEERRRREEAERERDDLRRELYARREPRESLETVEGASGGVEHTSYAVDVHERAQEATKAHEAAEEQQGRGQPQSAASGAREGARPRSWWRRMLGR